MGDALPADQLGLGFGGRGYVNRGLFADNFLENRLPELDEWKDVEGLAETYGIIRRLYDENAARLPKCNEAQTERNFVQPVLDVLWEEEKRGDCYEVQVLVPGQQSSRQPDYAFFRHAADREAAESQKGTTAFWRDVPCLGDAKKWRASLDKKRGVDDNPSAQITRYMYQARVRWGILTNGRIWRLYERERSSAGGVYYEVDLEGVLRRSDVAAFKYFYAFFRRAAFLPDRDGRTFLDKVYQGSVDYATEVGDRLKESVYDALRLLMNGFLENPANELERHDPDVLRSVHENSLVLLYRLLFLLYAEDRGLLPLQDPVYGDNSLKRLHKEISDNLRSGRAYLPAEHRCWPELMRLFELIDNGLSHEGRVIIPAYNGGLFHPAKHPHIAYAPQPDAKRWEIGDDRIAEVIDALAYRRDRWDEPGTQDIDYRTLDVQHLGSIYEGLLELQPRVAEEAMVEVSEGGKPTFKARREVTAPKSIRGQHPRGIGAGEAYLVTNRGERKATGSYYTPKYVVDYIVENTVGPVADEAAKRVAELRPDVDKAIAKLERTRKQWAKTVENGAREEADRHIADLDRAIEDQKRGLLDPYLSLKVLDPAMGSGHFLVGAADFLSMAMATDPNLLPPDSEDGEDPQAYYKRLIVGCCLYGVDLNPLAVELAKLSLWLHTVSTEKALSFLDHHLRCGNSLIGARVEDDLMKEPPRLTEKGKVVRGTEAQLVLGFYETLTAKHLQYLLDTFRRIVEAPSGDADTERQKDRWYQEMDAVRERFRAVANCWLAPYFGEPVSPEQYQQAVEALRGSEAKWKALTVETWFERAQQVARNQAFFHWELEFPEAFLEPHGFKPRAARGFDAVIGNPPYVQASAVLEECASRKLLLVRRAIEGREFESLRGRWDLFVPFVERALQLCRALGSCSQILSNAVEVSPFAGPLRDLLLRTGLARLDLMPDVEIFEGVGVRNTIYCARPSAEASSILRRVHIGTKFGVRVVESQVARADARRVFDPAFEPRLQCIEEESVPLGKLCYVCAGAQLQSDQGRFRGEFTKDRLISDRRSDVFNRLYVGGVDVGRYSLHNVHYVAYDQHVARMKRPRFRALFENRKLMVGYTSGAVYDDGRVFAQSDRDADWLYCNHNVLLAVLWCRLRSVRNRSLDRGVRELRALFPEVQARAELETLSASYDTRYLLAVYLSRAVQCYAARNVRRSTVSFTEQQLRQVPIRRIAFTTPDDQRARLFVEGRQHCDACVASGDDATALGFVQEQLAPTTQRADVVHDLLAHLAEQMIEMNKEKHSEETGFLTWLERAVGAEVDGLANKTRIKGYHESDLGSLLDVLRQNRRKLNVDPDSRPVQEKIEHEFSESVSKLTPLKERLAATDHLIDQIVYKLYGLTEEEIKMVEGGGG